MDEKIERGIFHALAKFVLENDENRRLAEKALGSEIDLEKAQKMLEENAPL